MGIILRRMSPAWLLLLLILVMGPPSSSIYSILADDVDEKTCAADDETCRHLLEEEETEEDSEKCADHYDDCELWANQEDECVNNAEFMHVNCKLSCNLCQIEWDEDDLVSGTDMGVPQDISESDEGEATRAIIIEAREYMAGVFLDESVKKLCRNEHPGCSFWATLGECEANPKYMKKSCAPACKTCEYLDFDKRCALDPDAPNSWSPGDLDAMFVRLTNEPYLSQYETKILSSPDNNGGPWVITMENVISDEEAAHLIELGGMQGYERSYGVGQLKASGTYINNIIPGRTSTNAWCKEDCYRNETSSTVANRLSQITGIKESNSEFLQLLRYEEGQHYVSHHDYIDFYIKRQPGVRILTVFLYLNDVENGGGTNFDKLNITVMPKQGRALLWPSVLNSDPHEVDPRTTHQALPVGKDSLKFGANAWFHQRDFKGASVRDCE